MREVVTSVGLLCGLFSSLACTGAAWAQPPPPADAAPATAAPKLTRAPELLTFVEAVYPPAALAEKRTAAVALAMNIELDGSVSNVEVATPAGHGFDEAAVAAAQQFKWRPAELDGKPAVVRIAYRYVFTLKAEEPEPAPTPVGVLIGELLERGTRAPLVGISVRIEGQDEPYFTDAKGRFEVKDLPAGPVVIHVEDEAFANLEDEEQIVAGQATEVRYYLEREAFDDTVQVVGRRPKKQVVRRTLAIDEIRTIPGTQGDALKVIQNMPGAARTLFSDQIILRGGGASQVFLDGHAIPLAFHFGGLRSTVASGLIESIDIYPGNYGVEYGRGNGGIVDIRLRRPAIDGLHGEVQVDVFDAGFMLEGPINDDWSFAIAARRSYIDAVLQAALPDDVLDTFAIAPRYYDGQAVVEGRVGAHTVRAMVYGSSDQLRILLPDDPEQPDAGFSIEQEWVGGRVGWTWRPDDRLRNELSASYTLSSVKFGANIGARPLGVDVIQHLITVRDELTLALGERLTLKVGTDTTVDRTELSGRLPQIEEEGEPEADGPPDFETATDFNDGLTFVNPAVYAKLEAKFGPVLLIPGVRADYFGASDKLYVQPRLTARWTVRPGTVIKGGVGLFAQAPRTEQLIDGLGTPGLDVETSLQGSLGFEQTLAEGLTLDVVGFYKSFDGLVTRSDTGADLYANQGTGRAYGMELLLRKTLTSRLYGWVAYTLSRSERRDAPGEALRVFDVDQTHNLTIVGQYTFTPTWELGVRWRYVTGNPSTPVTGADFNADTGEYVPRFGAVNSGRLDAFHQLDIRLDKHWIFDTWKLTTYLEVQNAYNRANPEEIEYQYDYARSGVQAGLPIVPSIGARGSF